MPDLNSQVSSKIDPAVGLLANTPQYIIDKINLNKDSNNDIELTVLYRDDSVAARKVIEDLGGEFEDLGFNFAIIKIKAEKIYELAESEEIQYIEFPKSLYASDFKSNRASCVPQVISTYNLSGKGVLVGFIDSGIDYTHPAFLDKDGMTRIEYIYDLSSGGRVYDKELINKAIKSDNPYDIVPEIDVTGHGTHVAGVACGGGNIPNQYKGVAQEASIVMVKGARGRWVLSSQILRGIRFLLDKSKELNMPLVINISLSTNDGAHDGTSLLEQYIRIVGNFEKVTIVVAAGNEGDAGHHASGPLEGIQSRSINIASDESQLVINIYKPILPDISVKLIGAGGESSESIKLKEGYFNGNIGRDRYDIYVSGPKPFQLNSEIQIIISSISSEYILSGEWTIEIETLNEYNGQFSMWIPISEGLNPETKFLQSNRLNTLGIPATVDNIIAVGSYDPISNDLSDFSGVGKGGQGVTVRPDLVAPGEDIAGPVPGGGYDMKTGTSMAAPQVSGICALFFEWGVVKQNDPYLFGQRLKYFLVKGATRNRVDVDYPSPMWGYGTICAYDSFVLLEDVINFILSQRDKSRQNDNDTQNPLIFENKENLNNLITDADKYAIDKSEVIGLIARYFNAKDVQGINNIPGASSIIISPNLIIIRIPIDRLREIEPYIKEIIPIYNPELYTLNALSPVGASSAPLVNDNPYLDLEGTEVIVGIIDTGIDYLNKEFMLEDDTTRIESIWDQTIESDNIKSNSAFFGTEYTKDQINEAIKLKNNGGDPYTIVPSKDENGHGTMVAGVIGARGRNPELRGVAPNCKFVIVKLKEASKFFLNLGGVDTNKKNVYASTEILAAINYLARKYERLERPIVMYLPMGTNVGGHDGTNPVEGFFSIQVTKIGIIPVTGTGNQGDTQTHIEGKIERTGEISTIDLKVGSNQRNLNFEIFLTKPDKVEIEIVSPSGEVLSKVDAKVNNFTDYKFVYEGTRVTIIYLYPDIITGDEVIIVRLRDVVEGTWQFRLYGDRIINGNYSAWLSQRELLDKNTRFFNPIKQTTLMIPATSDNVLVAAYYNQENNTIVSSSGKGYTRKGIIKPDIAAGGVNATVIQPGNKTSIASGSSIASAVLAGCCALMLQWAIINKNDPKIQFKKLQSYVIGGAKLRKGDMYPNIEWGYGILDIQSILDSFRKDMDLDKDIRYERFSDFKNQGSCEYQKGNLFYRFP